MNNSYKGKILISTPDVAGDIFSRSVILIIDHNESGAFGLILNKRNANVSSKLREVFNFPIQIYEGGPVENDKIFYIVKGKPINEFNMEINDEFYLTEDTQTVISQLLENKMEVEHVKVFSGYSGWAAQQLEEEVKNKYWNVVDIYNLDYTLPNDQGLWKNIMQNLGGEFLLWANAPEDITMN